MNKVLAKFYKMSNVVVKAVKTVNVRIIAYGLESL